MGDAELARDFAQRHRAAEAGRHPSRWWCMAAGRRSAACWSGSRSRSTFVDGLRVTDAATVEVVEMVLTGSINKQIVAAINAAGGRAVGLSGKDGNLIAGAKPRARARSGRASSRSTSASSASRTRSTRDPRRTSSRPTSIPVIAPIGVGPDGETYNINADTVAGAVAGALGAARCSC